jgi:E3 ubiquitin-protein ligase RNF144
MITFFVFQCITAYVNFEIQEGADEIACPDASCEKQGVLSFPELECLVSPAIMEKHEKFCHYRGM